VIQLVEKGEDARSSPDARRVKRLVASPEAYSFLLFSLLCLSAVALFSGLYLVFVFMVAVDALGTLVNSDAVVSADRSALFLLLIVLSVAQGSHDLFLLFLEVVLVIAALDFSFLLRKLRGTVVDASVIGSRLKSYAYTLLPAFALSYSLTFLYSFISGVPLPEPVALLAVSSAAALFAIYWISRYLRPRTASQSQPM
jgi:hypothetical protein